MAIFPNNFAPVSVRSKVAHLPGQKDGDKVKDLPKFRNSDEFFSCRISIRLNPENKHIFTSKTN